jgi:uncharacterized metal-binding protein YceD (DUF177 family)
LFHLQLVGACGEVRKIDIGKLTFMTRHGLVDLNEAVQNPGKRLAFDISTELDEVEDIDLLIPLEGVLEGVSTGNALIVKSEFKTRIVVECARCGEPIELDVEFTMDDDFPIEGIPSCYGSDGYAEVVNDEEYPLFDKNGLKIDDYLRQGLLLNLPTQPLCSGSWDIPCPNAPAVNSDRKYGHPALQDLQKFRSESD